MRTRQAPARAAEKSYDVYSRDCPARLVFDRLTDKWALLVIGRLRDGALRFNCLRRGVQGVSQKVLSHTLKKLERDGLVRRRVTQATPVTVEYSLTALGVTLVDAIDSLACWAESHMGEIEAAQRRFDAAHREAVPQ
ncbi:MAG TPA: helix-turn-helix domain-containing protein [Burkholderiaceae bacterium]|nr:helix-turn-helix domain-containing protein [Burkholderiaceae bacterium]